MTTLTYKIVPLFNAELVVNNLASTQILMSAAFTNTATLGTGTLTVQCGTTTATITIDETNNTVYGIANAITTAMANSAFAQVFNSVQGLQLVIGSLVSGGSNIISISTSDLTADNGLSGLGVTSTESSTPGGMSTIVSSNSSLPWVQASAGQNAYISYNGADLTSPTNTFYNAIAGTNIIVSEPD